MPISKRLRTLPSILAIRWWVMTVVRNIVRWCVWRWCAEWLSSTTRCRALWRETYATVSSPISVEHVISRCVRAKCLSIPTTSSSSPKSARSTAGRPPWFMTGRTRIGCGRMVERNRCLYCFLGKSPMLNLLPSSKRNSGVK